MELESAPLSASSKDGKSIRQNGGSVSTNHLSSSKEVEKKQRRRRCWFICLGLILFVLAIAIILLVLAFTVFKAKHPVVTVNSINIKDLNIDLDILRLQVHINVSLDIDLSLKNPNKVGFKYTNSTSSLEYRGKVVGEFPIPAGKISAGKTVGMNITLTLMADRLLSNAQLYSDVISGNMSLSTHTRISGKVHVLFFKVKVVSYTACDVNVNVINRSITDMDCRYKTKI
ncbi:uncharacterized protein LOC124927504 [Impatiens glandulifera]|uniref:uncharacterized protein LOC124927504 n=1 Tax=Impatiens glandulifera TaxID=253017 RepID=UPI001FB0E662|nr:uncharacterized protein LOC124927504 [Impatiens glandulifera]